MLLKLLALLSTLQNSAIVQDIEQCVFSNSTAATIGACILAKLTTNPAPVGSSDFHVIEAAKFLAAKL